MSESRYTFSFNSGIHPKFWFGQTVAPHPENARWLKPHLRGKIYGLEWNDEKFPFSKKGWQYWVKWDGWRYMSLHESEIEEAVS